MDLGGVGDCEDGDGMGFYYYYGVQSKIWCFLLHELKWDLGAFFSCHEAFNVVIIIVPDVSGIKISSNIEELRCIIRRVKSPGTRRTM